MGGDCGTWGFREWARGERYNDSNEGKNILKQATDHLGIHLNDRFEAWVGKKLFARVEGDKCVVYDRDSQQVDFVATEYNDVISAYRCFYVDGYYN